MHRLLFFIVALGAVAGKRQQYEQVEEQFHSGNDGLLNSNNRKRALIKNIFGLIEDSPAAEEKQLGFGQGSSRQGFKKGMKADSGIVKGMTQNKGMGSIGGENGMGNMAGMAKMGNRTMNMMMMKTTAPSTLIASFSPSPSPFPMSIAFPTQPNINKVYIAFVAPDLTVEPTPNQYEAMTQRLEEYFATILKNLKAFDTELEEIVLTNESNLFEKGIPAERFNILMNFDLSATYSNDAINIPDEEALFIAIRDFGISRELILDVVRPISPFETVNEIIFGTPSDLQELP